MQELINKLLADNLAALEGLHVSGSVPVRQELINEVIATVLAEGLPSSNKKSTSETAPDLAPLSSSEGGSKKAKIRLDPKMLLALVKRAEIKADDGKITFEFEIQR